MLTARHTCLISCYFTNKKIKNWSKIPPKKGKKEKKENLIIIRLPPYFIEFVFHNTCETWRHRVWASPLAHLRACTVGPKQSTRKRRRARKQSKAPTPPCPPLLTYKVFKLNPKTKPECLALNGSIMPTSRLHLSWLASETGPMIAPYTAGSPFGVLMHRALA